MTPPSTTGFGAVSRLPEPDSSRVRIMFRPPSSTNLMSTYLTRIWGFVQIHISEVLVGET